MNGKFNKIEQAQEDAYFYRLNRTARLPAERIGSDREVNGNVTEIPAAAGKSNPLFDYLEKALQPDEDWLVDL